MSCLMSIEQKLCEVKIFQLQSMLNVREDVPIKGLCSRILEFRVWPWYSSWKIRVWQTCMPKNQLQVAKYDESYTSFFKQLIWTYGLVVKTGCKESGDMGSNLDDCWSPLQCLGHFAWHWARQCTDTSAFYIAALSIFFLSWIWSVAISRWQSCKS